jgi:hypothetical protein
MEKIPLSAERWTPTPVPVESWRLVLLGKKNTIAIRRLSLHPGFGSAGDGD